MEYLLNGIIIISFVALFTLNIIYRVRLMKMFKQMSKLNIHLGVQHLLYKNRLINEVIQFNLPQEALIWNLWNTLRKAIGIAILLLLTILSCSVILNLL